MKFYKATDAAGRIYLRASASDRTYTHAVLNKHRKPSFCGSRGLALGIAGPDDEIAFAIEIGSLEYRKLNRATKNPTLGRGYAEAVAADAAKLNLPAPGKPRKPTKPTKPAAAKKAGDKGPALLAEMIPFGKHVETPAKAKKSSAKAKPAKAKKNAPAPIQRPANGKRAAILAAAEAGKLPSPPDFSAKTHERFRPKLAEVIALVKAGDIDGLRAFQINPISSSPKAIDRYRNLAVIALAAKKG